MCVCVVVVLQGDGEEGEGGGVDDAPTAGDPQEEGRSEGRRGGRGGRFRTRVYRRRTDGEQGDQQNQPRGPPVSLSILLYTCTGTCIHGPSFNWDA